MVKNLWWHCSVKQDEKYDIRFEGTVSTKNEIPEGHRRHHYRIQAPKSPAKVHSIAGGSIGEKVQRVVGRWGRRRRRGHEDAGEAESRVNGLLTIQRKYRALCGSSARGSAGRVGGQAGGGGAERASARRLRGRGRGVVATGIIAFISLHFDADIAVRVFGPDDVPLAPDCGRRFVPSSRPFPSPHPPLIIATRSRATLRPHPCRAHNRRIPNSRYASL
jgi:hypothetical protein